MTATAHSLSDYAQRILTARVYDVAIETPLDPMPRLSERLARTVLLRRLPSEGNAKSSAVKVRVEKIEVNQAIGKTRRKQENRFRGRGSIAEANGGECVEYERRQSVGREPASLR